MKIRLLSPTFGGTSGVGRHVESLSKKLMNKGYEVTVVSTNNTPYIPVKNLKNLSWAFFSCLKRERADIIHAHNLPSMIPAKTVEGKRILSIHGYYSSQIELLHGKILGKVLSLYEKKVLNWADSITCISKDTTHIYRNIGFNVEYVPNAVDVSKIEEICRDVERRPRRIVYVGRMTKEKGYGVLIKALKLLSDYEFITVHGRPWIEAIKLIASSKVLIVPSFMEGLPTVILEAFASGTAVIASEIGGIFELIKDKVNGYLFKPGDYYKLANLIDLVLKDERIHKNITNKAKDKVKREYDWEQVIRKYIRIYEES
ncbi:MAG: glycosyltransferase family 4 protein [Candidatus Methylarchaceae archaeon HK02M2]|nr:glycosyltransferase family 4 protein [Candidatus Methylarchaceae archaeon HK02M2]